MHHLTQVQRGLPGIEWATTRRRPRLDARAPRELAAHVLPGRLEDAVQELLVIQHGRIELLRPAGTHLGAVHRHHRAPGSRRTVLHAQPCAPGPTASLEHLHVIAQLHVGQRRLQRQLALLRIDDQLAGLEIGQGRPRPHVVGLRGIAIEGFAIGRSHRKARIIHHQVAADRRQPLRPQVGHQRMQILDHQMRVAAALQDQVALQHPVPNRPRGQEARRPAIARSQHRQRRMGRHQLHRGSRIERPLGLVHHAQHRLIRRPVCQRSIGFLAVRPRAPLVQYTAIPNADARVLPSRASLGRPMLDGGCRGP